MISRALMHAGLMQAVCSHTGSGSSSQVAATLLRLFSGRAESAAASATAHTSAEQEGAERAKTSDNAAGASVASGQDEPRTTDTDTRKKPEWYSTTPLILDARSNEPLKSAEYASSHDDKFGVQKNWFTSLYKQLNYFAKTGAVPGLKGRQREVFEAVEKEFEGLYDRYLKSSGLTGMEHRAMLMMILSLATYRILNDEIADPSLVRDVIRTNQGSLMMALLLPLHRMRLWLLRYLLAEEPYKLAVQFLPALQSDMGGLCETEIHPGPYKPVEGSSSDTSQTVEAPGANSSTAAAAAAAGPGQSASPRAAGAATLPDEVSLVVKRCMYHEVLTKEDAPHLLSEFCCHHGMTWLNEFQRHGVDVSLERSMVWQDSCCAIRVARPRKP